MRVGTGGALAILCAVYVGTRPSAPLFKSFKRASAAGDSGGSADPTRHAFDAWARDLREYTELNADADYFKEQPFRGARCVRIDTHWAYADAHCICRNCPNHQNRKTHRGLRDGMAVHALHCIYSNATASFFFTEHEGDYVREVERIRREIAAVTHYGSFAVSSMSNFVRTFTANAPASGFPDRKWYTLNVAAYFWYNSTSLERACGRSAVPHNVVCQFFKVCGGQHVEGN